MKDSRDDDALMAATATGDEAAFRSLVERWERRVLAFFYRSLGSREDAADLAQETFLRLYRSSFSYAGRGRFASFLFRIAGNLARNEIRKRSLRRFFSFRSEEKEDAVLLLEAPAADRPDHELHRAELAARVERALLTLPERQRVAVALKRFDGLTQKEIAEVLGVSESAVEALLARGMAALRKKLRGG